MTRFIEQNCSTRSKLDYGVFRNQDNETKMRIAEELGVQFRYAENIVNYKQVDNVSLTDS